MDRRLRGNSNYTSSLRSNATRTTYANHNTPVTRYTPRPAPQPSLTAERTRYCNVCLESLPISAFPRPGLVSFHNHGSNTCRRCFFKHVDTMIETNTAQIRCPECPQILTYQEVEAMSSVSVFPTYERAVLRSFVQEDAEFRYCMSTQCNSGQQHAGGADQPIFRCLDCGHKHCVICEIPWHQGQTCDQYQDGLRLQQNSDSLSAATIEEISKACPRCNARIQKNEGCDHMTCRCGHEFCWVCFADYKLIRRNGNHEHQRGCPYNRSFKLW